MVESSNKTIIVTGASQGLGKSIVEKILNGYNKTNVVLVARNQALLTGFFNGLEESKKSRVLIINGDVTEATTVEETISKTIERFGRIDGMVFNAGVIEPVGHLDEPDYDIQGMKKLFDVNFFSIVLFINRVLTRIGKEEQINIVFVSSGASTRGIDGWLAYGSSKAAVNLLCKQLHDEMYPRVRCVSVAPGVVNTEMQRTIREKFGTVMKAQSHERFLQLHKDGELLDANLVGDVYGRLVVSDDIPASVLGEYIRWNDGRLSTL